MNSSLNLPSSWRLVDQKMICLYIQLICSLAFPATKLKICRKKYLGDDLDPEFAAKNRRQIDLRNSKLEEPLKNYLNFRCNSAKKNWWICFDSAIAEKIIFLTDSSISHGILLINISTISYHIDCKLIEWKSDNSADEIIENVESLIDNLILGLNW